MADIYAATRAGTLDPWSAPWNLGPDVNRADGAETRPSLSWDGTTLYFGSTRRVGRPLRDDAVARLTDHVASPSRIESAPASAQG